jgi:hypothetical protein
VIRVLDLTKVAPLHFISGVVTTTQGRQTMRLEEYPDHLLDALGEIYSIIKTITPSAGRTAQDSLLEARCSFEELYSVARSSKTDSRIPVSREFLKLAARCIVESAQLSAMDEHEVRQWADPEKLAEEDAKAVGKRPAKAKPIRMTAA